MRPSPADEAAGMERALALAAAVRTTTSPNPWVGCVVLPGGYEGATRPPGGPHAERVALEAAGPAAAGSTLVVTLEPCAHEGRTPPCVDAIVTAGVRRVVVGIEDPDPHVRSSGVQALREAGVDVHVGVCGDEVREQLAPYLKHRETGRPWVVLKLAMTLDGRTAAPDGTSRWITGPEARLDTHALRAESDAILVGAGTVRTDDPELTVRHVAPNGRGPLRVVLGRAPKGARVHPALEVEGDLGTILDDLGRRGVLQLLVEGGPTTAAAFHRAGLVDRYVFYLSATLLGGDDGHPVFSGIGVSTLGKAWRGRLLRVQRVGDDIRVDLAPAEDG